MDIIGMVVSAIVFFIMTFQLIRSGCHYKRKIKTEWKSIAGVHFICILANFAYLLYEFNQTDKNPIPLMFCMMFLLNLVSVWTFFLIDANTEDGKSHMSPWGNKTFKGLIFLLCGLFLLGLFLGEYGVQCAKGRPAKGQMWMVLFSLCWTIFVIKHFKKSKDDTMLHARSSSIKEIIITSKNLALDDKKHDFDMKEMQLTQKKMYLTLQICVLMFWIIIPLQAILVEIFTKVSDPSHTFKSKCVLKPGEKTSFFTQDSAVTQILNGILLGIPVQQFVSCFYTVPLQFGFFSLQEVDKTKLEQIQEGLLPTEKTAEEETPAEAEGDDDKQE